MRARRLVLINVLAAASAEGQFDRRPVIVFHFFTVCRSRDGFGGRTSGGTSGRTGARGPADFDKRLRRGGRRRDGVDRLGDQIESSDRKGPVGSVFFFYDPFAQPLFFEL